MVAAKRSSKGPIAVARDVAARLSRTPLAPRAIRTAFRAQLAAALDELGKRAPSDEEVHSARKCIKKARASLRLLRETLGSTAYRRENQALRDAARPLSATRDAKVLTDVLDFMAKKRAIDPASAEALRGALVRNRKRLDRQIALHSGVASSRRALRAVDRRASQWSFARGDGDRVIVALKRIYRRARRAMATAREERSAETLHEWRKEVKYLWHQLQMLQALERDTGEIAGTLHELSDFLGQNHDLAVLRDTVLARRRLFLEAPCRRFSRRSKSGAWHSSERRFASARPCLSPSLQALRSDSRPRRSDSSLSASSCSACAPMSPSCRPALRLSSAAKEAHEYP